MYINVKSRGIDKAIQTAISNVKRNLSIYKIIYKTEWYYDIIHKNQSSFDFYYIFTNNDNVEKQINHVFANNSFTDFDFYGCQIYDLVDKINKIINKENLTDSENRIVNVINLFTLIDKYTPLYVRFLICIISLESLLLLSGDEIIYVGNCPKKYLSCSDKRNFGFVNTIK